MPDGNKCRCAVEVHRFSAITMLYLIHASALFAQDGIAIYVSPGVRIGWHAKGVTTIGGKISVGITSNSDLNYEDDFFI